MFNFWPETVLLFCKISQFLDLILNFFFFLKIGQFFCPKFYFLLLKFNPSLFFWPKKVIAFILFYWSILLPKNPFFLLKLSPACFFGLKNPFFSLKLGNFWTLFSKFSPIFWLKKSFLQLRDTLHILSRHHRCSF